MALAARIVRLEHARRGGGPPRCPECRGGGDDDGRWSATVEWLGLDEDPNPLECCPRCGESIEIVVWED